MQIEVRNVSKVFETGKKRVVALKDLNLSVKDGEFIGIIGPNGCGKTTLLNIVARIIPLTSGEVTFFGGREGETVTSMIWQDYRLFPWRPVNTNVSFPLEMKRIQKSFFRNITERFMELTGIIKFEDFYPHELSAGMKQRAGIARAYANNPDVLLMDEPFGSLDPQARILMQEELLAMWQKERKTILFVTHDLHEAVFLSDRIAVMSSSPGTIKEIIRVNIKRPRSFESKCDPEYGEVLNRLYKLLSADIKKAEMKEMEEKIQKERKRGPLFDEEDLW